MALPNELIDRDTGEIDYLAIHKYAHQRAAAVYGVDPYPPKMFRAAFQFAMDRARDLHLEWLRDHNLPRDDY